MFWIGSSEVKRKPRVAPLNMPRHLPQQFSLEMRALAVQVLKAQDARKNEDVDEWARRLADDVAGLTD